MKRFYARVEVVEAEPSGYTVQLDARSIKTPAGQPLVLPTRKLAEKVSVEWAAQREKIEPESMPLTGLSNAAIDRIGPNRSTVVDELSTYLASDPIRYRVSEPPELVALQTSKWDPVLQGFRDRFGIELATTSDLTALVDEPGSALCIRNYAEAKDGFALTAFANLSQHLGSVLIAMALSEGDMPPGDAFDAALLEELHQADRWGVDKEAVDRRRAIQSDVETAHAFGVLVVPD